MYRRFGVSLSLRVMVYLTASPAGYHQVAEMCSDQYSHKLLRVLSPPRSRLNAKLDRRLFSFRIRGNAVMQQVHKL